MTPVKSPCCGPGHASSYATFLAFEGRARVRLPIGTSSIVFGQPSSPFTTYSGYAGKPCSCKIESFDFALGRDAQSEGVLHRVHQGHRGDKGRDSDREAADHLRLQHAESAAIEQAGDRRCWDRPPGRRWARRTCRRRRDPATACPRFPRPCAPELRRSDRRCAGIRAGRFPRPPRCPRRFRAGTRLRDRPSSRGR